MITKTNEKLDADDIKQVFFSILWDIFFRILMTIFFIGGLLPTIALIVLLFDLRNAPIGEVLSSVFFGILGAIGSWFIKDFISLKYLKIQILELKNAQKEIIKGIVSNKAAYKSRSNKDNIHYYLFIGTKEYQVSKDQYQKINMGDKVIIEIMPESKLILGIRKAK